jgi:two-component system chemotaxis response regulator CheB
VTSHHLEVAARLPAHLVAIASSAGGITALQELLSALPRSLPAAVVVVQHIYPTRRSYLAEILARRAVIEVRQAHDGDALREGLALIAPPDRHLLITSDGSVRLSESEPVNFVRPSADRLFVSAAESFGVTTIAVVLTGSGSDGAEGLALVKRRGGVTIAQDRASSEHFGMPGAAAATSLVDFVLPLSEIAAKIVELVETEV